MYTMPKTLYRKCQLVCPHMFMYNILHVFKLQIVDTLDNVHYSNPLQCLLLHLIYIRLIAFCPQCFQRSG